MPVAKCSECGIWIHSSDDYRERSGFYTHEDCIDENDIFWNSTGTR